ncbi:MAG TPA: toll/interleukin-1 receptor domain-containing protein, partial [Acidimicrobiales bacterium]|nr:toll/interleukin-1 receptor domain-containing protein [Acidimicrobiales bacterium]
MSNVVGQSPAEPHRVRLFESYGRRDASDLAERLRADLEARGYEVWQDLQVNMTGSDWAEVIEKGIRGSDTVIAILSPHATRRGSDADNPDDADSTCLDEIAFARFGQPPRPIIPVMGIPCQPPLPIYRLDYVDLTGWKDSDDVYRRGLDRLCAGITGALEGRTSYRDLVVSLEPLDFAAFLNEKRDRFVGREWLFAEVDTWRHNDGERALLITGDPGAGKSAFVAELVYRNPDGQVVAYHCCQADVPLHVAPGPFVRSVATMLSTQLPAYAAAVERGRAREVLAGADADPETAFELGVIEPVAILPVPEGPAKYILIDGLDEAILRSGDGRRTIVDLLQTRIDRLPP